MPVFVLQRFGLWVVTLRKPQAAELRPLGRAADGRERQDRPRL
jgi:hypothetical protein